MIADDEIVYKRIPFAKGNGQKCCNCNKSSLTSKKCLIYVYKSFPVKRSKTICVPLFFCTDCNLYLTTAGQIQEINYRNEGYYAIGFYCSNTDELLDIIGTVKNEQPIPTKKQINSLSSLRPNF